LCFKQNRHRLDSHWKVKKAKISRNYQEPLEIKHMKSRILNLLLLIIPMFKSPCLGRYRRWNGTKRFDGRGDEDEIKKKKKKRFFFNLALECNQIRIVMMRNNGMGTKNRGNGNGWKSISLKCVQLRPSKKRFLSHRIKCIRIGQLKDVLKCSYHHLKKVIN